MRDKDEVNKKILDKEAIISELKSQLYGNVEEENNGSRNAMPDATMFQSFTDQNSTFSDNNVTITENQLSDGMHVSEEQISTYARISSIPSTSTAPVPKPSLPVTSHPTPAAVTKKQDKISAYRRMLVVGDSHCRGIGDVFKNYVPNKCHVKVICKPGSKVKEIVNVIDPDKVGKDTITCIIGGTKDMFTTDMVDIENSLDILKSKFKDKQLIWVLAPPRFDTQNINLHIANTNTKIKYYLANHPNITVIDPHAFLQRRHYSDDKIHLNQRGRKIFCKKIVLRVYGRTKPVLTTIKYIHVT